MQPLILLAVADNERRRIYEAFFDKEQVQYHTATCLRDVANQTAKQAYNALFIDIALILRASQFEKNLIDDAQRALPNARLNITGPSQRISMLVSWNAHESSRTPEEHLAYCCQQPPKIVFQRHRTPLNLNAALSRSADMGSAERTACVDISMGGCFLFCVNDDITADATVWVQLVTLKDQTPIQATVCWKRAWGVSNDMPGIGLRFEKLSESQHAQIILLCSDHLLE